MMDELHLDHEGRARAVLAADVEDGQLCSLGQGQLLAREVVERDDGLIARALEEVVQEAAENVRVRREDAPEDEVVLQVGEDHAPSYRRTGQGATTFAGPRERPQERRGSWVNVSMKRTITTAGLGAWSALLLLSMLPACGARSALEGAAGGGGEAESTTPNETTTAAPTCDALALVTPLSAMTSLGVMRRPGLALLPPESDVLLSYIGALQDDIGPLDTSGPLRVARISPFSVWPPEVMDVASLADDVVDVAVGPGKTGPVALVHGASKDTIATALYPALQGVDLEIGKGDVERESLFAGSANGTFLGAFGGVAVTPGDPSSAMEYGAVRVASEGPDAKPQSEGPDICTLSHALGAAVPSGAGFLAAFARPSDQQKGCAANDLLPATVLSVVRYDPPATPGAPLTITQGAELADSTEVALLGMAPASFGAWIVFRRSGPTGPTSGVLALRVDAAGNELVPGAPPIAVTSHGLYWPSLAVTSLGDSLVVAAADDTLFPAPTIDIQIVRPDGTLAKGTQIDTSDAVLSGRMALQPSADGQSLLLAWENTYGSGSAVLARVDCVSPL
jgi:hypothetical protein